MAAVGILRIFMIMVSFTSRPGLHPKLGASQNESAYGSVPDQNESAYGSVPDPFTARVRKLASVRDRHQRASGRSRKWSGGGQASKIGKRSSPARLWQHACG